jgi:hypothetical protein
VTTTHNTVALDSSWAVCGAFLEGERAKGNDWTIYRQFATCPACERRNVAIDARHNADMVALFVEAPATE